MDDLFRNYIYGKKITRLVDAYDVYNISEKTISRIFERKLTLVLRCRNSWPRFVSHTEDKTFRKDKWETTYNNTRLVMWDTTNIDLYKSSSAEIQRLTYSKYYSGNIGKGGVFIQSCGWLGTHDLWTGGISDSEYLIKSGILTLQQDYLRSGNCSHGSELSWTIMMDKGFRAVTQAWRAGKQMCVQPNFARSDRHFRAYETLRSAAVASDRGGNERAVKVSKTSGYLSKGLLPNEKCNHLCDVWLAWSFQANFMYEPVL